MTTAVEQVTDEIALTTLRDVVAERPGYTYSAPNHMKEDERDASCFYVHKDEDGSLVSAGCAIGVVLHRLGIPLEDLVKEEGCRAYGVVRRFFPNLSQRTYTRFNDMQMSQDDGDPWGLAYAKATGETI
ncbi:hypothetical protein SEA_SUCCESS_26 [Streptomyces phage Success]|uniref:Uncharacterized protein n=1 Tax=Streptomyces phage Success TaxID=2999013 RepID=A0A9E8M5X2_9CAUD|nr:hypothetical protein QEH47_gp26 [Streptomyces phage Success]WAB08813.1 hypothetical protein SEA_SUCCESS_26 [Streptomyces phage Success]